jgi:SET domain-containing protein
MTKIECDRSLFPEYISNSIVKLLQSYSDETSLVIVPKHHSNIARFLNGAKTVKDSNVNSIKAQVDGEVCVILYTKRLIKKGEELQWYYGIEYPTNDFI